PFAVVAGKERRGEVHQGGHAKDQPDVEGEVAGLRPVVRPFRPEANAVVDDDGACQEKQRRDDDLGALLAKRRPPLLLAFHSSPLGQGYFLPAMKPAVFMSAMWRASSRATQSA